MTTTALLAMDFQVGVVARYGDALTVVDRAAEALGAARKHELSIVYVRVAFRAGYPEVSPNNKSFSSLVAAGAQFTVDDPATQIHPRLAPGADEPVVLKKRVSAFAGSDLDVVLRGLGATSLVLCGIATSGVVLSTVRQAADLDYRLTVLTDACADGDPEVHRVLTEKVFPRQASTVTVAEWTASLDTP
ncbi:MAG TPA: isochorismatase family cysteine hydrolase [Micromonosporaceae bacterium]